MSRCTKHEVFVLEEICPAAGSHPLRVMPEEPGSSNVFNSYAQSKAPDAFGHSAGC
jgi:hypothetical protein